MQKNVVAPARRRISAVALTDTKDIWYNTTETAVAELAVAELAVAADVCSCFYVTKKSQPELCEEFRLMVEKVLDVSFPGRIDRFSDIMRFIFGRAIDHPLTLFIDEFQDFLKIDESIIGDFAREWDEYHSRAKINLVVCGSIDRLMGKIFKDDQAPLYGRNTAEFRIEPFGVPLLKEILSSHKPDWSNTKMGAWWDRKGENEIDLVCENEFSNRLDIYEVKREPIRLDATALERKVEAFLSKNPQCKSRNRSCLGLSMNDM